MYNKLIQIISITLSAALMVGCFTEGGEVEFGSGADYKHSKIVVLGSGLANGTTYLYVEVHSINSNGTVNDNWIPELNVANGDGTVVHNCNATNSSGVARCAITSTVPGVKVLSLDNAAGNFVQESANFLMPTMSLSVMTNVPASNINTVTATGYRVSASASTIKAPLRYEDGSGHIVYSTVQGIVLSDDTN